MNVVAKIAYEQGKRAGKNIMEGVDLVTLSLWDFFNWIILLLYIGIIASIIYIFKTYYLTKPSKKQKYLTLSEKEKLILKKKLLRSTGPSVVILYVIAIVGIWYIQKSIQNELIHLLILSIAYIVLDYLNISIKEKTYQISPQLEMTENHEKKEYDTRFGKRVLYVNAIVLLVFCVVYTQIKNFPFYGIWGIIAWAATLLSSYIPLLISVETYKNLDIFKRKRKFVFIIILSWIFVFFWLKLGLSIL